ncbi:MAG: PLP-dependent aminotransferase family protein [Acidobacteriaceae bacterium]|nr:PLP-dependent aminotransferase family protein [Acidobacteriaceae bacterium]MBV9764189.1 PLP-dependent aminotransferase family protein [Acidobacteriaceae bacterium]
MASTNQMITKSLGGISPVIAVHRGAAKPLHRQIYDAYRDGITAGQLSPGQQVPSSRALSSELGISRIPILEAYSQLLAEGYFESRAGTGTFVSSSLPDQLASSAHWSAELSQSGSRRVSRRADLTVWRRPWMHSSGPFSIGQLAFDHFPFSVWSTLMARRARKVNASSLNYSDAMGDKEFRETLALYLRTSRGVHCDPGQIMIVSGSQQALDLCARILVDPGDPVWVEEPGYGLMRHALKLAGCRLIPVPVDDQGLDVAAGIKKSATARAAYVTPSHQYPLGATMSASRRMQLLDWAHKVDSWIVEDDYDSEYRYESMPIASLQGLDQGSRVIYIGTFSKTLFPSLRIGYIVIPPDLVDRFATVRGATDICAPHFYQSVLTDFIDQGHYARHLRKTRLIYNERRYTLVNALQRAFGSGLQIMGAEAGMHVAVTLPPGLEDYEISLRAAEQNLWIWPLSTTYMGKNTRQGFILGFGSTKLSEMPKAVRCLQEVVLTRQKRG